MIFAFPTETYYNEKSDFNDMGVIMYIIVGLGNPDRRYQATRHNIGFDAVTRICDEYNISLNSREHKAICGKGVIQGQKVLVAQPQTYMNLSGESVGALVNYYKIDPEEELIILYDDINLDVGRLRIRGKGSAGGHNGIKSIIAHLGTEKFPRIRVGVGSKPEGWDLADYVLGHFPKEEEPKIREVLGDASDACRIIIEEGINAAMNEYNGKV